MRPKGQHRRLQPAASIPEGPAPPFVRKAAMLVVETSQLTRNAVCSHSLTARSCFHMESQILS